MLALVSCTAFTLIAPPVAAPHRALLPTAARAPSIAMLSSRTAPARSDEQVEVELEPEASGGGIFGPIGRGLKRLYPRRVVRSVATRIGLGRWFDKAAVTDAILTAELMRPKLIATRADETRNLAENSWEDTLLPPLQVHRRASLSELSWEDRLLPAVGGPSGRMQGRLSELSWEDRLLPCLTTARLYETDLAEDSWEDSLLPLSEPPLKVSRDLSESSWEDLLP